MRIVRLKIWQMEIATYSVIFIVILIGVLCILFGQCAERFAGIAILFITATDIILFRFLNGNFVDVDTARLVSDLMRFSAFFAISLGSAKIWPTFCSGILLTMLAASTFKIFDVPIGVFGGDEVRIACGLIVCTAISIGLWRNNTVRH